MNVESYTVEHISYAELVKLSKEQLIAAYREIHPVWQDQCATLADNDDPNAIEKFLVLYANMTRIETALAFSALERDVK